MANEYDANAANAANAPVDDGDDYEEELDADLDDGDAEGIAEAAADALRTSAEESVNTLYKHHPETLLDYEESILPKVPLQTAPPLQSGDKGIDEAHMSPPFLTTYERTKILGTRANQIAEGARPFVTVPEHIIEPLEIARLELEQRRLPFIIKRPMPDGSFEYWRLSDLMIL
jgi:DNA-directed RNA polymerase subunit K/omega